MRLRKSLKDHGMSLKSSTSPYYSNHSGPLPATDSWNLGTLIYEIFNGTFTNSEQLNSKGKIPQVHLYFVAIDIRMYSPLTNV